MEGFLGLPRIHPNLAVPLQPCVCLANRTAIGKYKGIAFSDFAGLERELIHQKRFVLRGGVPALKGRKEASSIRGGSLITCNHYGFKNWIVVEKEGPQNRSTEPPQLGLEFRGRPFWK